MRFLRVAAGTSGLVYGAYAVESMTINRSGNVINNTGVPDPIP